MRDAGFDLVTYADDYGRVFNQQIPDPQIISLCGKRRHILITADKRMELQYAPEIYAARIGIVLLINNLGGAEAWQSRLIAAQSAIREQIAKRRKPYLMRVAQNGTLTLIRLYRKPTDKIAYLY